MTEWLAVSILIMFGIIFDRVVLVLLQAQHNRYLTILLLSLFNNVLIFIVMFFIYLVHGFVEHPGGFGQGWLDWVTLVEGYLAAYLPSTFGFAWRVITKKEI